MFSFTIKLSVVHFSFRTFCKRRVKASGFGIIFLMNEFLEFPKVASYVWTLNRLRLLQGNVYGFNT